MSSRIFTLSALIAIIAIAGCGERTYRVTGSVTFDGKPVETGSIVFESADGGAGVFSSGIQNGKYDLQSKVGKKKVSISVRRIRPGTEKEPQPTYEEWIPARYNTETELFKEVAATENRFDFELKK